MTRKLRRRPNDPIPEKIEKRRKLPPAQISYLLEDKEIEKDLKIIKRGKSVPQIQKTGTYFLYLQDGHRTFKSSISLLFQ